MNISIESCNLSFSKYARKGIRQRTDTMLKRFTHRLRSAKLIFRDVNAHKGGVDKTCTVQARLTNGGEIVVTGKASSARKALYQALQRLRQLIVQRVSRERQRRHASFKGQQPV